MKFPLILSLVFCWLSAFNQPAARYAQASDLENEQILVQVNSTFLLTGETLYFKIFCRQRKNNAPTMLSKVAYVELVNEQGTSAFQTKVFLKGGSGHGDFFIPSNFSSGNYTMVVYTRWMRNFTTDSFYTNPITIVNPFMRSVEAAANKSQKVLVENAPSQPNDVQLKLSGETFKAREKVGLTLTSDGLVNVSVSVRKKEPSLDDAGTMLKRVNAEIVEQGEHESFLPEIRGHLITGTLTAKNEAAPKKKILASIPGSDFIFRATTTDQLGRFVLIVDSIPESSTMLFQILDDDISAYSLKIDNPFLGDYSKFRPEPLSIDAKLRAIIDERNVYTQIENAYYETKEDTFHLTHSRSFYNVPDKVYKLDDFTRFPTMEDVFREYVPEVMLKKSRNTFSLQIVNPNSGYPYPKEPLILIDGVPILDANTLMAYDPLKIERIEIVNKKYFYGSLESEGILSLKTYRGAIEDLPPVKSHRENLVRMQSGTIYSFPNYATDRIKLERVPDYRLQLHWGPGVTVSKDQTATVEFYTSDILGDFEIIVEGFSGTGELLTLRKQFSVVK